MTTQVLRVLTSRRRSQGGFTLVEMAIVGVFLGLLGVFAVMQVSTTATVDNTKASSMIDASRKIADNWSLIAQSCQLVSTDVTSEAVGAGPGVAAQDKNLSLLLGTAGPAAGRDSCYKESGVRTLTGLSSGAAGAERIAGFDVDLIGFGSDITSAARIGVVYKNVPRQVFSAVFVKYNGSSALPAAGASVTPAAFTRLGYTAETSSGARDVTLVMPL